MSGRYQAMSIIVPWELQSIESAHFQEQFSEHIRFQFTAVLPEDQAEETIALITEETTVEVQLTEEEKTRILFCGFVEQAELSLQGKVSFLSVTAVSYTAKLDRKKRSRSFYKTDVTWEEVLTCIKESEKGYTKFRYGAAWDLKEPIGVPVVQYQETDWEFLKRIAALWGMVVTPDATVAYPSFRLGLPQTGQPVALQAEELGMVRDLKECMEEHYQAGKSEKESFEELYYTGVWIRSRSYHTLGSKILFHQMAFILTYVEGYEENGEFWYGILAKVEGAVHTVYQGNLQIAGCSLEGTIKERKGNVVSLRLDIDQGNPYYAKEDGRDLFFPYALESKGYYCMPESGSRARLYLPSEREWEAIAVSAVRMAEEQAKRADRISAPEKKSFLNSSGVGVELTPEQITLSPDDGEEISIQLGKEGTIHIKGKNLTFAGMGIQIGKGGEESEPCQTLSFHADSMIYIARCTIDPETGEMVPIEDHILALEAISQIFAGSGIRHTTTGTPKAPSVSYDDSELVAQEKAEAEASNQSYEEALIARKSGGAAKFGKGLLMVAVGALAIVATGGAAVGVVVAVGCAAFGGALMEEGKQDRAYAEAGDLTTEAFNPLKKLIPEPAYTLLENAFCIAGSVIVAGPAVLIGPVANTSVSLAFDLIPDGRLDTPWETYLNGFSTQCMVSAISMKIGKAGSCESYWSKVKSDLIQQTASSIIGGIGNGQLTIEGLVEDFVTQLISAPISNLTEHKVWSAILDTSLDSTIDLGSQVYHNGWDKVDWKQVLQTGVNTLVTKLIYSCDPVCVSKGFLFQYMEDLWFEDLYGKFIMARRYQSTFAYDGAFGKGWYHAYESFLIGEKGILTAMLQDGHLESFVYQKDHWENTREGDRKYVLIEDQEKKEFCLIAQEAGNYYENTYNESGQLIRVKEQRGAIRSTILTYQKQETCSKITSDTENRRLYSELDTITTPGGRVLHFAYQNGRLVRLWDDFGREVRYEYQENRLSRVSYPDGGMQTYSYDKNGYLVSMDGENGVPYIENEYDIKGRVVCQTYPDGMKSYLQYDLEQRKTTIVFDTGRTEAYQYDTKDFVVQANFGKGREESYAYDEWGNLVEKTDRNGHKKRWKYDAYGCILEEESPGGLHTYYTYNEAHFLIRKEDNCKGKEEYKYDAQGNLIKERIELEEGEWKETSYTYDSYQRMITKTDARGNRSYYEYQGTSHQGPTVWRTEEGEEFFYTYDEIGRRTAITSDYGTVRFDYTPTGYVNRITDALGNVTRKIVDTRGNLLKLILPNQYQEEIDNGEGYRYRYDYMDRRIQITNPYGAILRQKWNMDGNLIQVIHPNAYDIETDDGAGIQYVYDESQYRIKEIASDGGIRRYITDSAGNLIKVIQPEEYAKKGEEGKGISYSYDEEDRLKEVRDEEGNVLVRFIYDRKGRLIKEINGEGFLSADIDEKRFGTLYFYNDVGWMVEKREPVKQQKKGEGIFYCLTRYQYDKEGNLIEEKRYQDYVTKEEESKEKPLCLFFTYDKRNRLIQVKDNLGAVITYDYNCLNQCIGERTQTEKFLGQKTTYLYDAVGQLIQVEVQEEKYDLMKQIWEKIQGVSKSVTQFFYDKNGNLIKILYPEGSQEIREYNQIDQIVKVIRKDTKAGICHEVTFTYDKAGNCLEERDKRGTMYYAYNLSNQIIRVEDREGGVNRFLYDRNKRLIAWIDADSYERQGENAPGVCFHYDELGRLSKTYDSSSYLQEWNQYGKNGKLIRKGNAEGVLVEYTYDIGGRQTAIITARAKKAGKVSQAYTYDARGNIIEVQDGEGNVTYYGFDLWGRITNIQNPDGSKEFYTYNYAGRVTTTTDGNGNMITYHYNGCNQISSVVDPVGKKEFYRYNKEGRVDSYTNRNGVEIHYTWGLDGILLAKEAIYQEETKEEERKYTYRYDENEQLIEAMGGGVQYTYRYTPNGWLKQKKVNGRDALSYRYTKGGQIKTFIDFSGKITEYEYNNQNDLICIRDNEQLVAEYGYDRKGQLEEVRFANGVWTQYKYDEENNLIQLQTTGKDGNSLLSYRYTYDGNGNRTLKEGTEESLSPRRIQYTYDRMQRLAQVSYSDGTEEHFVYDFAGNRVYKREENLEEFYYYDRCNRLQELIQKDRRGSTLSELHTVYTYDAQGNTQTELQVRNLEGMGSFEEKKKTYRYTVFEKTKKIEVEYLEKRRKEVQENFYDAENLRYAIKENGIQTNFLTNGWNVVSETDMDWKWKAHLIWGYGLTAVERKEGKVELGETYYYHANEHGDIEILTGEEGEIYNQYQYDAFGKITKLKETIRNRYTYYGEVYDNITEQYYLRARNYNPQIARFTQEDMYRGDGLNLYAYCANNAVVYIDPSGYIKIIDRPIYVKGEYVGIASYETDKYLYITLLSDVIERLNNTCGIPNINDSRIDGAFGEAACSRGVYIENVIAESLADQYIQIGESWDGYFPIIDLANKDFVVSIKSMNVFCYTKPLDEGKDRSKLMEGELVNNDKVVDRKAIINKFYEYYNAINKMDIRVNEKQVGKMLYIQTNAKKYDKMMNVIKKEFELKILGEEIKKVKTIEEIKKIEREYLMESKCARMIR